MIYFSLSTVVLRFLSLRLHVVQPQLCVSLRNSFAVMHCECKEVKVVYTQFIFIGVLGLSVSSINRKLETTFYNWLQNETIALTAALIEFSTFSCRVYSRAVFIERRLLKLVRKHYYSLPESDINSKHRSKSRCSVM